MNKSLQQQIDVANRKNNWALVIQLSGQFISEYPKLWQGYWWLGQAYKNLAQYPEAKAQFNVLISKFPNRPLAKVID